MNCDKKLYAMCAENYRDINPLLEDRKQIYNDKKDTTMKTFEIKESDLNKIFQLGNYAIDSKDFKLLTCLAHFWLTLFNMDRYLITNKI